MAYRIGAYLVDPEAYEMRLDGALVPVEPQVFDLLVFLIANRQRPLTKDEIIERIWQGRIVSDATLSSRIRTARQVLGDDGSAQKVIRTIHGRGFRFVGKVEEVDPAAAARSNPQEARLAKPDEGQAQASGLSNDREPSANGARPLPKRRLARQWVAIAAAFAVLLGAGFALSHLLPRPIGSNGVKRTPAARPAPAVQMAGATFKDCDVCPEMVELPAGEFMMGSPSHEPGRTQVEGPQQHVAIAHRVAIGKFEVTVDQFAAFVANTGFKDGSGCQVIVKYNRGLPQWEQVDGSFRNPRFDVTGAHPAVCVSWHDAQAYTAWLGRRTGKPYRLPTEAEWEYAARAATTTSYSYGSDETQLCGYGRFADLSSPFPHRGACRVDRVTDGALPVGTLKPNPWGLFDMHGNAWELVADCWTPDVRHRPGDGSAFTHPRSCELGVIRGGSWASGYPRLRSTYRTPMIAALRRYHIGFRLALTIDLRPVVSDQ